MLLLMSPVFNVIRMVDKNKVFISIVVMTAVTNTPANYDSKLIMVLKSFNKHAPGQP
jgi:hypothetical protein